MAFGYNVQVYSEEALSGRNPQLLYLIEYSAVMYDRDTQQKYSDVVPAVIPCRNFKQKYLDRINLYKYLTIVFLSDLMTLDSSWNRGVCYA